VQRGGRAVDPGAQPAEALEPAEGALNHIAHPLQRGVFGIQLTNSLLSQDAPPGRDERQEPLNMHKLPEALAVVALVGEQGRFGRLLLIHRHVPTQR